MLGRVQLSCGHVDIERMIIYDDNPNQGEIGGRAWVRRWVGGGIGNLEKQFS